MLWAKDGSRPATSGRGRGDNPLAPKPPHFAPKAKRVIYLHMSGAPPQLDLFDYKPELVKHDGQPCPDEFLKGKRFAFIKGHPKLLGTPHTFTQHGKGGAGCRDAHARTCTTVADELCVIRSMQTDQFNHAPAELLLYTGSPRTGRPAMGSWVTYGLGSENENLPGFVVLISSGVQPNGGKARWGSGFLPGGLPGRAVPVEGRPGPLRLRPAPGWTARRRRRASTPCATSTRCRRSEFGHPETLTRISQYELAFRMQMSVPEVMDIRRSRRHVLEDYGAQPGGVELRQQLPARPPAGRAGRAVRAALRLGLGLPRHQRPSEDIVDGLPEKCTDDGPAGRGADPGPEAARAARRDAGRSGAASSAARRSARAARPARKVLGRDHYPHCFTMLLAGGGVKRGITHGETDELGFSVARDKVPVHDLQATILHLLGLDHETLTYRFQGRDYRLTDVEGQVVKEILT